MNEFLATLPFDLYELSLFRLVVEQGSFTRAALKAGLTQSAVTRQIRGIERSVGAALLERTTRRVDLTPMGRMLYERSKSILNATDDLWRQVQEAAGSAPPRLRVGVARSIGLAYFPGFFFAFRRQFPNVQLHVTQQTSSEILESLEENALDVGLLCPPPRVSRSLEVTHRFDDGFTLILPPTLPQAGILRGGNRALVRKALKNERWLMINGEGNTGKQLRAWLRRKGWPVEAAMELDSFDVIVNLVALGMGVSFVPHRVLPIYEQRRAVTRISMAERFVRELVVVIRKSSRESGHVSGFVDTVLF